MRNPDGSVTTPPGYRQAYKRFVEAGWPAISFPEEWGGGGLPFVVGLAVAEMLTSADMAFSLCPMLTYAADELLLLHGTEEQKATFLPHLVAGEWTGTMLLTEAQAGSDVGPSPPRRSPPATAPTASPAPRSSSPGASTTSPTTSSTSPWPASPAPRPAPRASPSS